MGPFRFLFHPGMLAEGSWLQIADALRSGMLFTGAIALLCGRTPLTVWASWNSLLPMVVMVLAILPYRVGLPGGGPLGSAAVHPARQRDRSRQRSGSTQREAEAANQAG